MKKLMKYLAVSLFFILLLLLPSSCQRAMPVCPPVTGTPEYLAIPPEDLATPIFLASPTQVEVNGRMIQVDKVVEGPLCNDTWSGTVYVTCNVQVYPWEEQPTFLKNCNLSIAPGTIVYVAYHYDTAYYNGCSCHTGDFAGP